MKWLGTLPSKFFSTLGWTSVDGSSIPVSSSDTAVTITTELEALQINAVWSCVRLISSAIASLPVHVYRKDKEGKRVRQFDHRVAKLLGQTPNSLMTAFEYREASMVNLLLEGNSYSVLSYDGNEIISALPIPYDKMKVSMVDGRRQYAYHTDKGHWVEIPQKNLLHLKGFGYDGLCGLSPIGFCSESLGYAKALTKTGKASAENGMRQGGVLSVDQYLKPDQRESYKSQYKDMHKGIDNAHELMVLEGGLKFTPSAIPASDAQFLENRAMQTEEIARIYNVPPHMIGVMDKATSWGSGIEQQAIGFITYTLGSYLTRSEQLYNLKLFTDEERDSGYYVKHNVEGLLRGDSKGRAAYLTSLVTNGIITRNEARAYEDLEKSEQPLADLLTVQAQMVTEIIDVEDENGLIATNRSKPNDEDEEA